MLTHKHRRVKMKLVWEERLAIFCLHSTKIRGLGRQLVYHQSIENITRVVCSTWRHLCITMAGFFMLRDINI